jgi:hypothetical protein
MTGPTLQVGGDRSHGTRAGRRRVAVIAQTTGAADPAEQERLRLPAGDQVLRITRVRMKDQQATASSPHEAELRLEGRGTPLRSISWIRQGSTRAKKTCGLCWDDEPFDLGVGCLRGCGHDTPLSLRGFLVVDSAPSICRANDAQQNGLPRSCARAAPCQSIGRFISSYVARPAGSQCQYAPPLPAPLRTCPILPSPCPAPCHAQARARKCPPLFRSRGRAREAPQREDDKFKRGLRTGNK